MSRNHRLLVQSPIAGNELEGVPEGRWSDVTPVWASIEPLGGTEYSQGQQMKGTASHKLTTEFVRTANRTMRLIVPNTEHPNGEPLRVFHVESVVNVEERNRESLWMCQEVV